MKSLHLIVGAFVALWLAPGHAQAQDVNQIVEKVCSKCHEMDGNSASPKYPKLAGQRKEYLLNQLNAFRDHSRKDADAHEHMWEVARSLNDESTVKLADYFSAQKPKRGTPGDPQLAAKGKAIFEFGVKTKNVPQCVLCHTKTAEGLGVFPRLAGQHAQYLVKQIKVFHTDDRPKYGVTMKAVVDRLSDAEAEQVAAYLQGL